MTRSQRRQPLDAFCRSRLIWGSVVLVLFPLGAAAQGDEVGAAFRTEAPAAWRAYFEANKYAQGTSRTVKSDLKGEIRWLMRPGCDLVENRYLTAGKIELHAMNSKYAFTLKRSTTGPWVLADSHPMPVPRHIEESLILKRLGEGLTPIDEVVGTRPGGPRLWDVMGSPQTRLAEVVGEEYEGRRTTHAKLTTDLPVNRGQRLVGLELWVDPGRAWLPLKIRTRYAAALATQGYEIEVREHTYGDGPNPLPKYTRWTQDSISPTGERQMSLSGQVELELSAATIPPEEQFTLSAFGLPEPLGVVWPKRSFTWVWFVAAGVGLVISMLGFRWLSRRAARCRSAAP